MADDADGLGPSAVTTSHRADTRRAYSRQWLGKTLSSRTDPFTHPYDLDGFRQTCRWAQCRLRLVPTLRIRSVKIRQFEALRSLRYLPGLAELREPLVYESDVDELDSGFDGHPPLWEDGEVVLVNLK